MSDLLLKVCGMKNPENLQELAEIGPDFIGFIFYPKSPRYVNGIDESIINSISNQIKKVGVFVDENPSDLVRTAEKFSLDYVQLHGDESVEYIHQIKNETLKIIKVFRIGNGLPNSMEDYVGLVDYFLFDTATSNYGGSGKQFDWEVLKKYDLDVPYILSGGIQLSDVKRIKKLKLRQMVGIDVNSKFEIEPGKKDLELVKQLKEGL